MFSKKVKSHQRSLTAICLTFTCLVLVLFLQDKHTASASYAPKSGHNNDQKAQELHTTGDHLSRSQDYQSQRANAPAFGSIDQDTGELYNLKHQQADSENGITLVQVQRRSRSKDAPKQELHRGKTMVVVKSKSGKFNQLLPLDDLIVSPASLSQYNSQPGLIEPTSDNHDQEYELLTSDRSRNLPHQSVAGAAASIRGDNLIKLNTNESQVDGQEAKHRPSYSPTGDLDLTAVRSANDGSIEVASNSGQETPEETEIEEISADQMPDSIESLMRSAGEELDDQYDPKDQSASEPVQNIDQELSESSQVDTNESGDDDDESEEPTPAEPLATLPVAHQNRASQSVQPEAVTRQPSAHMINSAQDLNTAAGHYHGKKKKKVKKKKVKIVIKKKKKKKKKKVKIVKIVKKKKIKKKKKKSKKVHHDHGKYYMYAKVPKKKSWEFGFKKGNKKHWIERHEKGHKNKFKTKVKWYDKKSKGKGIHIWDYNHHDKKKKKHYG